MFYALNITWFCAEYKAAEKEERQYCAWVTLRSCLGSQNHIVNRQRANSFAQQFVFASQRCKVWRKQLYKLQHYQYLIKWQDWSPQDCTWEPSDNLEELIIRSYEKPKINRLRREEACRQFFCSIIIIFLQFVSAWIYRHNPWIGKGKNPDTEATSCVRWKIL